MKDWKTLQPDVVKLLNKHFTPGRNGNKIDKVVIHHNAGVLSIDQIWQVWQDRPASAHYQVEIGGRIGQLVWDRDTAWHAANSWVNQTSIGIEFANSAGASADWPISSKTIEEGAHLVAAVCHYYKLGRPQAGTNVRFHREFTSTSCPHHLAPGGKYYDTLMSRAQYWYDNPDGTPKAGTSTPTPSNEGESMFGPEQVAALHDAKVAAQEARDTARTNREALAELDRKVKLIEDQLLGPEQSQWPADQRNPNGGRGWPQLGDNVKGQWHTLVDFLSTKGR